MELDSYARLQHDGRRQRAVREGIVAGLTSRNYHRAVHGVLSGYGIEKSSVSREFVQASAAQLKELCEKKLGALDLVAILIDGIHFGKQVLVVALGIQTSGEKQVFRAVARSDGKHHGGEGVAGRPGGTRSGITGAALLVRDRQERKRCERGSSGCSVSVPKCSAVRSTNGGT